jgi:hypothetical protein
MNNSSRLSFLKGYDLKENLPKWDGATCDDNTFNGYYKADNPINLGNKAPVGKTCTSDNLQAEGCGFERLKAILSGENAGNSLYHIENNVHAG